MIQFSQFHVCNLAEKLKKTGSPLTLESVKAIKLSRQITSFLWLLSWINKKAVTSQLCRQCFSLNKLMWTSYCVQLPMLTFSSTEWFFFVIFHHHPSFQVDNKAYLKATCEIAPMEIIRSRQNLEPDNRHRKKFSVLPECYSLVSSKDSPRVHSTLYICVCVVCLLIGIKCLIQLCGTQSVDKNVWLLQSCV